MGWPVSWLQEMLSADEFDKWCVYHNHFPLDDQSNHHFPVAQLEASLINVNRRDGADPIDFRDRLIFGRDERDIEQEIAKGNW